MNTDIIVGAAVFVEVYYLRDADGKLILDADGNPIIVENPN